ncbi:hypothetical protein, partial [Rhizobium binae]|uniref:hypothetical protein n=1 Tax=Rhizobium binae TaxID=1138190 RepID=UPI003396E7F8
MQPVARSFRHQRAHTSDEVGSAPLLVGIDEPSVTLRPSWSSEKAITTLISIRAPWLWRQLHWS